MTEDHMLMRHILTATSQYGIFFASAGHAALIDYPHATNLKRIAAKVWENGGVVSAV